MDEERFDNIARRLGALRTRRDALKTAGCGTAAAVFAALGFDNSALAQVTGQNHCKALGVPCQKKRNCCGNRRKSNEIVCGLSNAGSGKRCCGRTRASCDGDTDCCLNYVCNIANECVLPPAP